MTSANCSGGLLTAEFIVPALIERRYRSEILGDGLAALGITTGEIDAADTAITRMRAISGAGVIKVRIENVLAMFSRRQAVIDDERNHNVACSRFSIRDVFAPARTPHSIPAHARAGIASIAAVVTHCPVHLVRAMIGRAATHSGRKCQRQQWPRRVKKTDRIIKRAYAFFRAPPGVPRQDERFSIEMRSQFFDVAGVERWILTGEIHLMDYRVAGNGFFSSESLTGEKK